MTPPLRCTVIGAECTGKTDLALALGSVLGAPVVPEAARVFVDRRGRAVVRGDEAAIVHLHLELAARAESAAAMTGSRWVVYDTDLVSTVVYARHYQGICPRGIERLAARRRADLYLLAGTEVPWEGEPGQRGTPADRIAVDRMVEATLRRRRVAWARLTGPTAARLRRALDLVAQMNVARAGLADRHGRPPFTNSF